MNDRNIEDIIGTLYDLVQDARSMPLAADRCILERDRVLDMLDEIIAQLPGELKQSRTIVESRNELISQARREAETILRQAQEQAKGQTESSHVFPHQASTSFSPKKGTGREAYSLCDRLMIISSTAEVASITAAQM